MAGGGGLFTASDFGVIVRDQLIPANTPSATPSQTPTKPARAKKAGSQGRQPPTPDPEEGSDSSTSTSSSDSDSAEQPRSTRKSKQSKPRGSSEARPHHPRPPSDTEGDTEGEISAPPSRKRRRVFFSHADAMTNLTPQSLTPLAAAAILYFHKKTPISNGGSLHNSSSPPTGRPGSGP